MRSKPEYLKEFNENKRQIVKYLKESWEIKYNPSLIKMFHDFKIYEREPMLLLVISLLNLRKREILDLKFELHGIVRVVKYNASKTDDIDGLAMFLTICAIFCFTS